MLRVSLLIYYYSCPLPAPALQKRSCLCGERSTRCTPSPTPPACPSAASAGQAGRGPRGGWSTRWGGAGRRQRDIRDAAWKQRGSVVLQSTPPALRRASPAERTRPIPAPESLRHLPGFLSSGHHGSAHRGFFWRCYVRSRRGSFWPSRWKAGSGIGQRSEAAARALM